MSALQQLVAEQVEPRRDELRTPADWPRGRPPSEVRLLAEALAARRIRMKKVTAGRWVFEFSDTVIGGYALDDPADAASPGITTLVSGHARRVLHNPQSVRSHLDLMDVPHSDQETEHDAAEAGESLDEEGLRLLVYAVGRRVVSVLAVVPPHATGDSHPALAGPMLVDVTELVDAELTGLAVDAMRSIPGLLAAEIQLQVSGLDTAEGGLVLDISETASILPHHFPTLGPGRGIAEALAEQILFTAAL